MSIPIPDLSRMRPSQAKNRILVAVCGLNPQIVTGTLYGLVNSDDPFLPTEIHLITTQVGADKAKRLLLEPLNGWFHRLCVDLNLPFIEFGEASIHVMSDHEQRPMNDIRTVADNEAAADFIVKKVRALTQVPDSALHVSIAGGRKTMGYYLGYALSLYGRAQDRLSHVLVSEPYDSCPDYFYPTMYSHILQPPSGHVLDARNAKVTLAEIPFFSLRAGLPTDLLDGAVGFSQAVKTVQATLTAKSELIVDLKGRRIQAAGIAIDLPPAELAFFLTFLLRILRNEPPLSAPKKYVPDLAWAARYLEAYRMVVGQMADADSTERALREGMDGDYFSQRKSKLEKKLRLALGYACEPYSIQAISKRPTYYGLKLKSSDIRLITNSQTSESELVERGERLVFTVDAKQDCQ